MCHPHCHWSHTWLWGTLLSKPTIALMARGQCTWHLEVPYKTWHCALPWEQHWIWVLEMHIHFIIRWKSEPNVVHSDHFSINIWFQCNSKLYTFLIYIYAICSFFRTAGFVLVAMAAEFVVHCLLTSSWSSGHLAIVCSAASIGMITCYAWDGDRIEQLISLLILTFAKEKLFLKQTNLCFFESKYLLLI